MKTHENESPPFILHDFQLTDIKNALRRKKKLSLEKPNVIVFEIKDRFSTEIYPKSIFSQKEQKRASQFHFDSNRREFLFSRGILRSVVASVCDIPAEEIILEEGDFKKPRLLNPECSKIDINITHSNNWVAIAIIKNGLIGVDIENFHKKNIKNINNLVSRIFSTNEQTALSGLSEPELLRLFYRGWTRKEAILKALGLGLSMEPNTVEVFHLSSQDKLEEIPSMWINDKFWCCFSRSIKDFLELSVAFCKCSEDA